jgi:gliding motility-associated-like protein
VISNIINVSIGSFDSIQQPAVKILIFCLVFLLMHEFIHAQITGISILGDPCSSQTLVLQAEGKSNSSYFTWDFGDPASGKNDTVTITGGSSISFPTHSFSAPGTYEVCVTYEEPGFPITKTCEKVLVGLCCSGIMEATDQCVGNYIFFSVLTVSPIITISWDFGDTASGASNRSNRLEPDHRFSAPGIYDVQATVIAPCDTFVVTARWNIISCGVQDTCTGTISVRDSCVAAGTLFGIQTLSDLHALYTVQWNFGDTFSVTGNTSDLLNPVHRYNIAGVYTVTAAIRLSCGTDTVQRSINITECNAAPSPDCQVLAPNAFSPNGDGRNDVFKTALYGSCSLEQYQLMIYNRWGQVVYKTTDPEDGWNGLQFSSQAPPGAYVYLVNYKFRGYRNQTANGNLMLIR